MFCAKVFCAASSSALSKLRYNHHQMWHRDETRCAGRFVVKTVAMRVLTPGEAADWRCPLCKVGVPAGEMAKGSKAAFTQTKEAHRLRAHPRITPLDFAKRCRAFGARQELSVMRKRAQNLNRLQAKRQLAGGPNNHVGMRGFVPFTWPRLGKNPRNQLRLRLRSAWRCKKCPRCFLNPREAREHGCSEASKATKERVRQLKHLRRQAHKYQRPSAVER